MRYQILSVDDQPSASEAGYALANSVNDSMKDGWKPQGGISLTYSSIEECYSASQAMVKED